MKAHRFAILPALASAMLLFGPSTPAHAQVRVPEWGARDRDVRNEAYTNGYDRGYREGTGDARSGRSTDYRRVREYRDADWGYHDRYGSRDQYKREFRQGFEAGYRDAFSGVRRSVRAPLPPYADRDYGYGAPGYGAYGYGNLQVAANYGYNDGYERGVKAARSRKAFDPNREGWYRDGDRHYDRDYGSRERYRASYREGFLRGYNAGYRSLGGYASR
jgi:hypothetical protein